MNVFKNLRHVFLTTFELLMYWILITYKINIFYIRRKDAKFSLFQGECIFFLVVKRIYRESSLCHRHAKKKHPLKK